MYEIATLPLVTRNDNLLYKDCSACSRQSEEIFFLPGDDTGIIMFVLIFFQQKNQEASILIFFDIIFSISFLEKTQADCDQVGGREYRMLKGMREILKN